MRFGPLNADATTVKHQTKCNHKLSSVACALHGAEIKDKEAGLTIACAVGCYKKACFPLVEVLCFYADRFSTLAFLGHAKCDYYSWLNICNSLFP